MLYVVVAAKIVLGPDDLSSHHQAAGVKAVLHECGLSPLLGARGYRGDLGIRVGPGIFRVWDQPVDRPPLDFVCRPRSLISGLLARASARTCGRGSVGGWVKLTSVRRQNQLPTPKLYAIKVVLLLRDAGAIRRWPLVGGLRSAGSPPRRGMPTVSRRWRASCPRTFWRKEKAAYWRLGVC